MPHCIACNNDIILSEKTRTILAHFPDEPEPSLCVRCGHKRRLLFRNGRHLYRRTCDSTGEPIVSIYAPEKPHTVYRSDVWWSDRWDPKAYGRDIDWNRPFFEQFRELQETVPRIALTNLRSENSDYCNMTEGNKNCYLLFGGDFNEDCLYGVLGMHNRSCIDCDLSNRNELCCFLGDSFECYGTRFAFDSKSCKDCAFVSDCIGCSDCILCTNLVQKTYCIRNEQLTKDEYLKRRSELLSGSHEQQSNNWQEFLEMRAKRIVRHAHILASEDCTGDYIHSSKGCHNCFDTAESEDVGDTCVSYNGTDSAYSSYFGHKSTLCYDIQSSISAYHSRHSCSVFSSSDVEYCDFVFQSKNLFGCACMKNGEFCILNKPYNEEEFSTLRQQLIEHMQKTGEWGKFFPPECSPFGYNESTASSHYPLTRAEAEHEGFSWFEKEEPPQDVKRMIAAGDLPETINDIPDDILQCAIECERTKRPFKIMKQELAFYRSCNIPVPRLHPDERYKERLALRNPMQLWSRTCAKCEKPIATSYAPERPETVVCDECYLKEVY